MNYSTNSIQEVLNRFHNAKLSLTPTPIYQLSRLSSHVGRNIYIMRDDLTGFAIGGNKVRKLDYLIGDAMARGADTLITTSSSSFSRNMAAAGKVFGFEVHVILVGDESEQNSASQALFEQFETVLYYVPNTGQEALTTEYDRIIGKLKKQGKVVYEMHPGGSDSIGTLGYINAFDQILQYSHSSGIHFDNIIHSTGSAATQAGLLLGQCISEYDSTIIGMAASQKAGVQFERVRKLALSTAHMLEIQFDESRIVVEDGFIGPGYAIQSEEGRKAAKLFAVMEGVLLDDVYTAKAAAGLIHYAMNEKFGEDENVLFVHTGGNSGLFY
jgi:1-aminocyclopropane-1-carboxylate deaminase/D-cysteine desulfhydrase-like pyridoxal-dependent ACC family enzyme